MGSASCSGHLSYYKPRIIRALRKHPKLRMPNPKITLLGVGENNINLLVQSRAEKVVFRIGQRKELEPNVSREYRFLSKIPAGYGPAPIFLDTSRKIIPSTYSVTSYVEGEQVKAWKREHFKIHAKKLAGLHKKRYPVKKRFDLRKEVIKDMDCYKEYRQEPTIRKVYPLVLKEIEQHNHLFLGLKHHSMIHGDISPSNILFKDQECKYIDWEWATFGDPATDFARFFFPDFGLYPWFIKLDEKGQCFLLREYSKYRKDNTMNQRVKIMHNYYKFSDFFYLVWKLDHFKTEKTVMPRSFYERAFRTYKKSLENTYL